MDEFSYLSVLVSIILGLSITQILQGLGGLMQTREQVRIYWPAVGWAGLLLMIDVQSWWAMFSLRDFHGWNFLTFLVILMQVIVLYLLAALVLPSFAGEARVDLHANYFSHRRWFFGLQCSLVIISVLKDVLLNGALPVPVNLGAHIIFFFGCLGALLTRREVYHKSFVLSTAVFLVVYIAVLFAHLP